MEAPLVVLTRMTASPPLPQPTTTTTVIARTAQRRRDACLWGNLLRNDTMRGVAIGGGSWFLVEPT